MYIRKAQPGDIPQIMRIYDEARQSMRRGGNMQQWINGYPSESLIRDDIEQGVSYVCCEKDELYCVFAFIIGEDPTYDRIDDGQWPNSEPYGTIHRIGSDGRKKGLFPLCYDFCRSMIKNIRIDTHADNALMHHILKKHGFTRCGVIYVYDGSPRVAYCN